MYRRIIVKLNCFSLRLELYIFQFENIYTYISKNIHWLRTFIIENHLPFVFHVLFKINELVLCLSPLESFTNVNFNLMLMLFFRTYVMRKFIKIPQGVHYRVSFLDFWKRLVKIIERYYYVGTGVFLNIVKHCLHFVAMVT